MNNFIRKFCGHSGLAIALQLGLILPVTAQQTPREYALIEMELQLEAEFEGHFERDLTSVRRTPEEMANTLTEIATTTGANPAVLWAIPKVDHLHLVLLTLDGEFIVRDLYDVPKQKLQATASRLARSVTSPRRPFDQTTAKQLHDWLLKPFEDELTQAEIDTLLVCLGDGLRGIPLAALHDGDRFLIEKYALTRIPAFNLTRHHHESVQQGELLAMGASEFSELSPLPAVPLELETIVQQLRSVRPAIEPWQELSILNQDFTPDDFKAILSHRSFDIVHLATHADFVPGHPRESYIKFYGQKLPLDQLHELDWEKADVELLVLSACRTAVGDSKAELGFAGLALHLGVDSVIGSLWSISDAGTLALMADFYQELSLQPIKAEALRQAQVKMLQGKVQFDGDRLLLSRGAVVPIPADLSTQLPSTQDLSHPYYWAGFSMISSPW